MIRPGFNWSSEESRITKDKYKHSELDVTHQKKGPGISVIFMHVFDREYILMTGVESVGVSIIFVCPSTRVSESLS